MKFYPVVALFLGIVLGFLIGSGLSRVDSESGSVQSKGELAFKAGGEPRVVDGAEERQSRGLEIRSGYLGEEETEPEFEDQTSTQRIQSLMAEPISLASITELSLLAQRIDGVELIGILENLNSSRADNTAQWVAVALMHLAVAELDREEAFHVLQIGDFDEQTKISLKIGIFNQWATEEPEAAFGAALLVADEDERRALIYATLQSLAQVDPGRALLLHQESGSVDRGILANIFWHWGQQDPQAAEIAASRLPEEEQERAYSSLASGLARAKPELALLVLEQIQNKEIRSRTLNQMVQHSSRQDFGFALRLLESISDPYERSEVTRDSIYMLVQADREKAVELVEGLIDGRPKWEAFQRLVQQFSQSDPRTAVELAEQIPYGNYYRSALASIASNWVEVDAEAALQWAASLQTGEVRDRVYENIFRHLVKSPDEAIQWINEFSGVEKVMLIEQIAQAKAARDPQGGLQWIETLEDGELAEKGLLRFLRTWANNEPAAVVAYLEASGQRDRIRSDLRSVISTWAGRDLPAALSWANELENGALRDRSMEMIAREWLSQDTYQASRWIAEMEPKSTRERLAGILIDRTYRSDPESAFQWGLTLENDSQRTRRFNKILDEMVRRGNRDRALELIGSAGFPAELHSNLVERVSDPARR